MAIYHWVTSYMQNVPKLFDASRDSEMVYVKGRLINAICYLHHSSLQIDCNFLKAMISYLLEEV